MLMLSSHSHFFPPFLWSYDLTVNLGTFAHPSVSPIDFILQHPSAPATCLLYLSFVHHRIILHCYTFNKSDSITGRQILRLRPTTTTTGNELTIREKDLIVIQNPKGVHRTWTGRTTRNIRCMVVGQRKAIRHCQISKWVRDSVSLIDHNWESQIPDLG
jgi:hypothetical protein